MYEKQAGFNSLPNAVKAGLKRTVSGEKPFLLSPLNWLASKAVGQKKVDELYWKAVQGPILKADMALGSLAQKGSSAIHPGLGKAFTESKLLDMGKKKGLATGKTEYDLPSVIAPVTKASKFVIPLLGAIKLDEIIKGKSKMENQKITKADLKKTAGLLLSLKDQKNQLIKEAKAGELIFKQAELGQIAYPKTHAEFKEKVAQLLRKDLNVVEEAIKMASSNDEMSSFGTLETGSPNVGNGRNAYEMFQSSIIEMD
jgi:hypothetical protein